MSKTRKCTASLNKSKGDEFEVIEYEEVILSDVEDDESFTREASYCKKNVDSRSLNSKQNKNDTTSFSDSCTSMDIEKLTDRPFKKVARKPARPIRLFSFTDHDIIDKFSLTDPAKKNLTMQLLDIVKSVNSNRKLKLEKSGAVIPNFYIMATKQDLSDQTRKIISMKSGDIVSLIKEVVHMIKACVYREVDDIEIICDSPAIFLIKYVNVKNWDSTMNAVYVVTSEYLLPYLCKIRAAQEQEKNSKLIVASISKEVRKKPKNSVHITKKPKIEHQTKKEVEIYKPSKETFSQDVICPHTDEEMIESILSKYLEREAVDFFLTQVKTSGKFGNRFRWSEKDKFFALNLLRKNPTEYSILYEKYCLPSDKTIDKFLKQIKHERIDDIKIEDE